MTIGTIINDFLTTSVTLVPALNIYPVVVNEDTQLPFIVYNHSISDVEYQKDGWAGDECNFSVAAVAGDYAELQAIIVEIRAALELQRISGTQRIQLTGMDEVEWLDNMFGQKLNFSVTIDKY